jgi:hypothetical protein
MTFNAAVSKSIGIRDVAIRSSIGNCFCPIDELLLTALPSSSSNRSKYKTEHTSFEK